MKKFLKENWFKLGILICAIIFAFGYLCGICSKYHCNSSETAPFVQKMEKKYSN